MLQFEVLLAPLYALIREVEQEQLRGGRLLNLLHSKCHCGIPELRACMQRYVYALLLLTFCSAQVVRSSETHEFRHNLPVESTLTKDWVPG